LNESPVHGLDQLTKIDLVAVFGQRLGDPEEVVVVIAERLVERWLLVRSHSKPDLSRSHNDAHATMFISLWIVGEQRM
jgi:hypothetical protein